MGKTGLFDSGSHGIGETATGWVEAPKEMVEESNRTCPAVGVTRDAVVGTVKAVGKTVKGAAKTATSSFRTIRNKAVLFSCFRVTPAREKWPGTVSSI